MKKRLLTLILVFALTSLTGCEKDGFDASLEPPLSKEILTMAVPDFLTEEQQLLYRRTYSLYQHMWNGETSAIDNYPLLDDKVKNKTYETYFQNDINYLISIGRFSNWNEFILLVDSIFTKDFFDEKNTLQNGSRIYIECDAKLCIQDLSRGGNGNYNENFDDEFILLKETEDTIVFEVIGHFSEFYPMDGETIEERNKRREQEFEYKKSKIIRMVRESGKWKFSDFSLLSD
jgi:hypothetical protein